MDNDDLINVDNLLLELKKQAATISSIGDAANRTKAARLFKELQSLRSTAETLSTYALRGCSLEDCLRLLGQEELSSIQESYVLSIIDGFNDSLKKDKALYNLLDLVSNGEYSQEDYVALSGHPLTEEEYRRLGYLRRK
jgi:hypothetical protein